MLGVSALCSTLLRGGLMFFRTASASGLTPNVKVLNFTDAIIRCYRWENSYQSKPPAKPEA